MLILLIFYFLENDWRSVETLLFIREFYCVKFKKPLAINFLFIYCN